MIRLIIKCDHYGPDGNAMAPSYRTVDIRDENLDRALKPESTYSSAAVIGAELIVNGE